MISKYDKSLKEALKIFAKKACCILEESQLPMSYHHQIPQLIGDVSSDDSQAKEHYPLTGIAEAIAYKKEISEHPEINNQFNLSLGIAKGGKFVGKWGILRQFMISLIEKQSGIKFEENAFNILFEEIMQFFRSRMLTIQMIFPLDYFFMEEDSLELENGWSIQKIPERITNIFKKQQETPYSFVEYSSKWLRFALVKQYQAQRLIGFEEIIQSSDSQIRRIRNEKDDIISAMRILKIGSVICSSEIQNVVGWHVGFPDLDDVNLESDISSDLVTEYRIHRKELYELLEIIRLLENVKDDDSFQVSLRRLNFASERIDFHRQDQVIDYVIALESLLLLRQDRELVHRLGLRCAALVGESSEERHEIKKDIKFAFRLRSDIIHAYTNEQIDRRLKKVGYSFDSFVEHLGHLFRKTLKEYLHEIQMKRKHDKVIQSLDDRILNDMSMKAIEKFSSKKISNIDILKELEKLGGTPERIVQLLRARGMIQETDSEKTTI